MKKMSHASLAVIMGFIFAISATSGFAADDKKAEEKKTEGQTELKVPDMKVAAGDWCDEHGVPESVCSRCSEKVATAAKEKGDWCKKHKRADTQCFLCHPDMKEKWLALKPKDAGRKESEEKK